jgi:2-succinyl-5-enolpyruvyl-6-hydroxy-3-cyclohexene-1-carboxylate synthase
MFSSKKNVLETVALLKAHGITDIVLSPGSRNAPLLLSFAAEPFFTCHTVVDERSAGFYALGLIQGLQRPVAVCCTSGTALVNLGPAVAEAHYQELPLIVISADRSAAWIEQMDGQTLPQPGLFGSMVRASVQLPEIQSSEDHWHCNRLINEALNACTRRGCGPVHLNIPISEPLFEATVEVLPEVRTFTAHASSTLSDVSTYAAAFRNAQRPMIVVGQRLPKASPLNAILERFTHTHGTVVLAEHLSNAQTPCVVSGFDTILATPPDATLAPDLLLTLGGHLVSKRIRHFLRAHRPAQHWHLSPSDGSPDLYQSLTQVVQADPVVFLEQLLKALETAKTPVDPSYRERWNHLSHRWKVRLSETPLWKALPPSDLSLTGALLNAMPGGAVLCVGNSSSVRNIQCFELPKGVRVYCNRGTNGIEGTLSTACGLAATTSDPVWVLLGDLSFFYDLNALTLPLPSHLRIVVSNNGGGGIFHRLPGMPRSEDFHRHVTAAHPLEAGPWAEAAGIGYRKAEVTDLEATLGEWMQEPSVSARLLEVITDPEQGVLATQTYTSLFEF